MKLSEKLGSYQVVKRLNDLSGSEWLPNTRSAFIDGVSEPYESLSWDTDCLLPFASRTVLSTATVRPDAKREHPATFPESDAGRLIRFFTQEGGRVLDPFIGTGSTAVACIEESRTCIGFELYPKWVRLAQDRVRGGGPDIAIYEQDALDGVAGLADDSQDFILTSPPYWGILQKRDHKARIEREKLSLPTDYGDDPRDLSKIESYEDFLDVLECHFGEWHRVLRPKSYAAVIVSDFRHGCAYYPFHAHVGDRMESAGLTLQGLIVVVQDSKRLYPYGFPTSYVPNICNQFVVIGRKLE